MTGQNVIYQVDINDARVHSAFGRMESDALSFERALSGVHSSLATLGIAIGAADIVAFAKNFVQVAADFEVAMLRIKNASDDAFTGVKNQLFISNEADAFKIKIDEAAESYGKFLFKIKNAHISSDIKNNLFNEILAISKVGGLTSAQMESTIFQTSTLLGEGVLEARHLRQLSMVHPNLMPYIADQMGLKDYKKDEFIKLLHTNEEDTSALQKLSQLMSNTKLTKLGLNSIDILIPAFNKYYESIKDKVPETLGLIQSGINEIHTSWVRFDSEVVQKLKPELTELFETIKDGIGWLKAHEDGLITWGKLIGELLKIWIEYKAVMLAINLAHEGLISFSTWLGGAATTEIALVESKTVAYTELAAAIERLNFVQNAQNASFITTAAGVSMANTAGNRYALAATEVEEGAAAAAVTSGSIVPVLGQILMAVLVLWEIYKFMQENFDKGLSERNKLEMASAASHRDQYGNTTNPDASFQYDPKVVYDPKTRTFVRVDNIAAGITATDKKGSGGNHIVPQNDHITGQRVINYYIRINGGVNGQKIEKQIIEKSGDVDVNHIMEEVSRGLESIINDTQLHGD